MSLKFLVKLSHFVTMMFGIALGMTLCIIYQFNVDMFIIGLSPLILVIILISSCLRGYTLIIWRKNNYNEKVFND